jgi:adenylate cyclase
MSPSPIESGSPEERRLAAIVVSDVAGYSARMQRDETGTMALVRADFARMEELAAAQGGEVLNTMGDGMLLGFGSAVQAVTFALQVQSEFAYRRAMKPPEQALEHRIGIHVGDVFRQDGRVAGDGVNIAARLQAKAPIGGISVSQTVHDLIKGKIAVQAVALGPQEFKNITEKIPVYNLVLPGGAAPAAGRPNRGQLGLVAVLIAFGLLGAAGAWWWKSRAEAGATEKIAAPPAAVAAAVVAPAIADKSIAVLPFANMSDDKENAYFTDGVQEDILTDLANLGGLKVISRTSVIQYRDSTKPLRQIGTELGVAYILEGSVRRAGNKVRVTGQLINAQTDEHVWAANYDRDLTDIFAIQGELATEIALALKTALTPREKSDLGAKPTNDIAAYDLYLQARALQQHGLNLRDQLAQVRPLLEHAVQIDPGFAVAWATLAQLHLSAYAAYDRSESRLVQARVALEAASRVQPDAPAVMIVQALYHSYRREADRAADIYRQVIQAYPNNTAALRGLAEVNRRLGRWAEALALLREVQKLDPRGFETIVALGDLLLDLRHYDEAEPLAKEAAARQPDNLWRAFRVATISLRANGSTAVLDALRAAIPLSTARTNRDAIMVLALAMFSTGDHEGFLRVWKESGSKWIFVPKEPSFDLVPVAMAFLIQGEPARARPLLENARDHLTAELVAEPDNFQKWMDLGQVQAMLGEKRPALEAAEKARTLAAASHDAVEGARMAVEAVEVEAWAGDKARAIDEVARLFHDPDASIELNVHLLKHIMIWWPLQDDPKFQALLNDPANNAPLL